LPNAAASQEREIPSSRLYPLSFIEYVAGLIVGSYSGFLSPPYRFRGGRIWSRPAARANRARSFRRRIEQPSRRDRARPDGGIPCTKRSSGRGRRQRCRASAAGLGAGTVGARTAPRATSVPREQVDAVEAPQRLEISPQDPRPEKLLEADNSPDPVKKAEPRKADNCGHCGKPLATLRSAASRYCDRYCAKAARKAGGAQRVDPCVGE